jgi:hypothetical protein
LRSSSQPTPPPPPPTNTTAAQNPFPLAQSEGLQSPPPPPSTPEVPPGETHAQVTAPLVYNGETSESVGIPASSLSAPEPTPSSAPAPPKPAPNPACSDPLFPGVVCDQNSALSPATPPNQNPPAAPAADTTKPKKKSAFARFLHKVFGGD